MQVKLSCAALLLLGMSASCAATVEDPGSGGASSLRVVTAAGVTDAGASYAGMGECPTCHAGIFRRWSGSAHAGSFATLVAAGEEKNPACLRCHTTAYGTRQGFGGPAGTPDMASVSCEACHGPSKDHARSAFPAMVGTARGSECSGCDAARVCRECHTSRHSPDFVLSSAMAVLHCGGNSGRPSTAETGAER